MLTGLSSGDAGNLGLFMTSYKPLVVCHADEKAPPRLNCARLLGSMMTSTGWLNFGIARFPRDWVPLPKPLREGELLSFHKSKVPETHTVTGI